MPRAADQAIGVYSHVWAHPVFREVCFCTDIDFKNVRCTGYFQEVADYRLSWSSEDTFPAVIFFRRASTND